MTAHEAKVRIAVELIRAREEAEAPHRTYQEKQLIDQFRFTASMLTYRQLAEVAKRL
jgi:hypothetical protein